MKAGYRLSPFYQLKARRQRSARGPLGRPDGASHLSPHGMSYCPATSLVAFEIRFGFTDNTDKRSEVADIQHHRNKGG